MVEKSETLLRSLFNTENASDIEVIPSKGIFRLPPAPNKPTETTASQKRRLGQDYFRQIVLNNFDNTCGVCGLNIRELLVASHIIPWAKNPAVRLDVRNGLCLSRLHDAAFDQGFISFNKDMCLMLSPRLKSCLPQKAIEQNFSIHEGCHLVFPTHAIPPDEKYLDFHRKEVFQKN
jgi:putative restriction endonuclease